MKRYEQSKRWSLLYPALMLLACTTQAQGHLGETKEQITQALGSAITQKQPNSNGTVEIWRKGAYTIQATFHPYGNCTKLLIRKKANTEFSKEEAIKIRAFLCPNHVFTPLADFQREFTNGELEFAKDGTYQSVFTKTATGNILMLRDTRPDKNTKNPGIAKKWAEYQQTETKPATIGATYKTFEDKWGKSYQTELSTYGFNATWIEQGYEITAIFAGKTGPCFKIVIHPIARQSSGFPADILPSMEKRFIPQAQFNEIWTEAQLSEQEKKKRKAQDKKDFPYGTGTPHPNRFFFKNKSIIHISEDGRFRSVYLNSYDALGTELGIWLIDMSLDVTAQNSTSSNLKDL